MNQNNAAFLLILFIILYQEQCSSQQYYILTYCKLHTIVLLFIHGTKVTASYGTRSFVVHLV